MNNILRVGRGSLVTFRYLTAKATHRVRSCVSGKIAEVSYFGPLSTAAFDALAPPLIQATDHSISAVVLRSDCSLSILDALPAAHKSAYPEDFPALAHVCRAEDYDFWQAYAKKQAGIGIRRVIFLESQLAMAYAFAEQSALQHARRHA